MKKQLNLLMLAMIFALSTVWYGLYAQKNYAKTLEVTSPDKVFAITDFASFTGANSNRKDTRIRVKNGKADENGTIFAIHMPKTAYMNLQKLDGQFEILDRGDHFVVRFYGEGNGAFNYQYKDGSGVITEFSVFYSVNYYGVLQVDGRDVGNLVEINSDSDLNKQLISPAALSKLTNRWSVAEKNSSQFTKIEEEIGFMTLGQILNAAKAQFGEAIKEFQLKVEFGDTTTNVLADGSPGGASEQVLTIRDNRIPSYTISTSVQGSIGGSVSPASQTLTAGSNVTITATPAANYEFVEWLENGSQVATQASYSFTLNGSRNLVAVFREKARPNYTANVSVKDGVGGSVSVDPSGPVIEGRYVVVEATPETNYEFVQWQENGNQVSTQARYGFNIEANRNLVAVFRLKSYTISTSVQGSQGGSVSPASQTLTAGSNVTITATPAANYEFVEWLENGSQVATQASYSFTLNGNRNLVAVFREKVAPAPEIPTNFTTTLYQREAEVRWEQGARAVKWQVVLKLNNTIVSEKEVQQPSIILHNLSPGSSYSVSITAIDTNGQASQALTQQFQAQSLQGEVPYLAGIETSTIFSVNQVFMLHWMDITYKDSTSTPSFRYTLQHADSSTSSSAFEYNSEHQTLTFKEQGTFILKIDLPGNSGEWEKVEYRIKVE